MNDFKKFKKFDERLIIFLYRDVAMFWEKYVSKNEVSASTKKNEKLKKYIMKDRRINYYATNAVDINEKKIKNDEAYFTNSGRNIVSSLMKHLRNSIMHGRYTIANDKNGIYIEFTDQKQKKITMKAKIYVDTLKQLISCFD